jgi:alpha-galactosidase
LWAMFRSPLMFGGDLPSNDEFTLKLITNDEVLAINQHSTGGRELWNREGLAAWVADAPESQDKYLAFFNIGDAPRRGRGRRGRRSGAEAAAPAGRAPDDVGELGFDGACRVRDLWAGEDLGEFADSFAASIRPHAAGLYRVSRKAD